MARLTIGIRDTGAYSTRGTGKGGLLAESAAILRALQRGVAPADLRTEVLAGRILHQRARITREGILKRLAHRLLDHGQPWIFEALLVAFHQGERSPEFLSSLGAHRVMIPTTNAADLGSIPSELLDILSVEFFSDPMQAAFKALVEA